MWIPLPLVWMALNSNNQKVPEPTDPENPGTVLAPVPFAAGVNAYNPNTGILRTNLSGYAEVRIYDMRGQIVGSMDAKVPAGQSVLNIDRDLLPKGNYVVKVMLNGKTIAKSSFSLK